MGYSISVCCKSPKARDRLVEFLRGAMRPFSLVCEERTDVRDDLDEWYELNHPPTYGRPFALPNSTRLYDPTQRIHVGEELAYGAGKNKVGFNFSTMGDMGVYMYALLKWAALHSGRKIRLTELNNLCGRKDLSVPYITYDSKPIPVLLPAMTMGWSKGAQKQARQWVVNPLGIQPFDDFRDYIQDIFYSQVELGTHEPLYRSFYQRDKALQTIAEQEMRRLNDLWNDFTSTPTSCP